MINRTRIKDSIYDILDEDPKKIKEYIDAEAEKEPEQKEKEKEERNKKSNIEDVNLQENIDNQEDNPYNKIVIHTEKDNLVHNYFHHFDMYWDAGDCMSSAILKLPKTDNENTKYWITYTGYVTIYLGNEINTEMHKSDTTSNVETYWDLKGMKPIFKGEIGQIKEYSKELEIHVDSIGKRFKQKIPDEFRQSFINNQNVRDAFQAICEFIGVKYICPPGKPPEQDNQTTTTPAADGTENSVDSKNAQETAMATAVSEAADKTDKESSDNESTNANNATSTTNPQDTTAQTNLNEATKQSDVQNGYSDISFDSGGAIVHGSSSIMTSPDMEDTLLALEEHPLDSYLDDTTFVATDVKKFLDGEMFDELHGNVMNYSSVTIKPKSSASSTMGGIGSGGGTTGNMDANNDGVVSDEEARQYGYNLALQGQTGVSLSGVSMLGSPSSQNTTGTAASASSGGSGKRRLSRAYINTLSMSHAAELAKRTSEFDDVTIKALRRRAIGAYW